ncbi:YbjN domain-containing protein [Altericroceibacterium xinjiangense]|uniref:YbjN domain-containing protein n=1 Tax=Altericroceibacterium xinjiangense TaxID=762261 RepID=UPI000F7DF384|nr:YbjN domain-containing protein [Altericroceibacterium xinjiangense]
MNTGSENVQATEDAAPVEMLVQLFEAHGWPCDFVSDDEVSGEIQGSWTSYKLRGVWRREDNVLQILCLPEIRIPRERHKQAFELVALINEQLWLGHFDIWSNGGILLYRHALMLGEDGLLTLRMARAAIDAAVTECDRFYPAFQFVLWGDKNPRDALEAALVDHAGEA